MGYLVLLLIWFGIIMACAALWSIIEDVRDWLTMRRIKKCLERYRKNTDSRSQKDDE